MTFDELMENPVVSGMMFVCTSIVENVIGDIWGNITKQQMSHIIKRSINKTIDCVGDYKDHIIIAQNLSEKLENIFVENWQGNNLETIILIELDNVLKSYDLQNMQYKREFVSFFLFFFISELQKDDELWKKVNYAYINAIYQEVLNTGKRVELSEEKFQYGIAQTKRILHKYMIGAVGYNFYESRIPALIDEWNLKNGKDVAEFQDIFSFLTEIVQYSWKERCRSAVEQLSITNSVSRMKIQELSECFDNATSCNDVRMKLKEILPLLDKEQKKHLIEIERMNYEKCLIISGEPGAGKTEFIKNAIGYFDEASGIYVVPVNPVELEGCQNIIEFEEVLIKCINYYLGSRFTRLIDIVAYCEMQENVRIIIAIDDVHRMWNKKGNIYDLLVRTLMINSGINYLFWILTVNEYYMYVFDEIDQKDFKRYTLVNREFRYGNCNLFQYDFNLTKYNQYLKMGTNILKSYECSNVEVLLEENCKICAKRIENPMIAHFIGSMKGDIGVLQLKSFYIDFAESIIRYLQDVLNKILKQRTGNNGKISKGIKMLGKYIINQKTILISQEEFEDIAEKDLEIALKQMGLIIRSEKLTNMDFISIDYGKEEEILKFHFDIYWANRVVAVSGLGKLIDDKDAFYNMFSELIKIKQYCEEICEYVLYFLDKRGDVNAWEQWISILNEIKRMYVLLIYLDRLENTSIVEISSILKRDKMNLSKKDIFTLVYALRNIAIDVKDKYEMIALYVSEIEVYNKTYVNFISMFSGITREHKSCEELLKNVCCFLDSNASDLNKVIGSICADSFFNMCKGDFTKGIELIEKFIDNEQEQLKNVDKRKRRERKQKKCFFDEFLKQFFYLSISLKGVGETYNILNGKNLFEKKGWHHDLYRYNFSHAAGDFFAKHKTVFVTSEERTFRKEYIAIVRQLVKTRNMPKVIFGYHFITNSLENDRDNSEKLDPDLRDILYIIYKMKGLDDFKMKHKTFFERVHRGKE